MNRGVRPGRFSPANGSPPRASGSSSGRVGAIDDNALAPSIIGFSETEVTQRPGRVWETSSGRPSRAFAGSIPVAGANPSERSPGGGRTRIPPLSSDPGQGRSTRADESPMKSGGVKVSQINALGVVDAPDSGCT